VRAVPGPPARYQPGRSRSGIGQGGGPGIQEGATPADLAGTVSEVQALGRRIVAAEADVRDAAALRAAVASGVAQLGAVDIVLANAGIGMTSEDASEEQAFRDQV
jgi:NAD(P)-dependent dehydrogenase (short-subunit alcohol dehydrogenase family)